MRPGCLSAENETRKEVVELEIDDKADNFERNWNL